jgi:hypothetical protein
MLATARWIGLLNMAVWSREYVAGDVRLAGAAALRLVLLAEDTFMVGVV